MEKISDFFSNMFSKISWPAWGEIADATGSFLLPIFTLICRFVLPLLAIIVVTRCALSLLKGKSEPETWAWLDVGGARMPINHWENIIGRGKFADILIPLPEVSRNHAALIRSAEGKWTLIDVAKSGLLLVNGRSVQEETVLVMGDEIDVAGNKMTLQEITPEEDEQQRANRAIPGKKIRAERTMLVLSIFSLLMCVQLMLAQGSEWMLAIALAFSWVVGLMWLLWLVSRMLRRTGFEIEILAFFLCILGTAVVASGSPDELTKQCLAMTMGVAGFFVLGLILREIRLIKALRWPAAAAALAMLLAVLIFGQEIYGAKNWLVIGSTSFQPSEFVKVLFVFAGSATLDRLFARRNLYSFLALSAAIVAVLALCNDFGTAIIFFVVYLVIAFMRSGDWGTVALSIASAALAGVLVLTIKPHIAYRFEAWRHAWEFASTSGYQQTRTMIVTASGGLFGLGGGQGWLKYVAASETDLVFGFVSEEWGLIIALLAVVVIIIMALFVYKSSFNARSSYYIIAASAAAAMLLFQTMLNVGGSLDILPLTGVTLPFVSNGGTSMIACWCLLAFIKAVDTRQNASFALGLQRMKRPRRRNKLQKEVAADE